MRYEVLDLAPADLLPYHGFPLRKQGRTIAIFAERADAEAVCAKLNQLCECVEPHTGYQSSLCTKCNKISL